MIACCPSRFRTRARGFSLIELVVVVMILGIMTSIATPVYFHVLARGRVDAAARRIVADLDLVRSAAEVSSSSRSIEFFPANDNYVVVGVADLDRPHLDYNVRLRAAPYACDLISADFGGAALLQYNGFGVPQSGGTIVVQSGNLQRTVSIDVTTGEGTIQ